MVDLHRHDECSIFDGFGKPIELATLAKELGHTSLGIANHGNTNSLVKHFYACKEVGIKPIMGVEGYFLPKFKNHARGFHLCIFAKNKQGYSNMNKLQFEGEKQKYYNPIWDFKLLEKYKEGLICTSACVASYLAQHIKNDNIEKAEKFLIKMVKIFKDDFYIEIQPYKVSEKNLQEKVNIESINLAKKLGIKCILTSDSHYGHKDDFDTYMKMHEIARHSDTFDIEKIYKERYMPTEKELRERFCRMHKNDFSENELKNSLNEMILNLKEIENKVDGEILNQFELELPKFDKNKDSFNFLKEQTKEGLIKKNKWIKEYKKRAMEELKVIKYHGFEDYFLMVADYTNWAKNQGIAVGPGRGSGCNCLVNYALNITDVDPILFDLDFNRFLRYDKNKMPDIDLDFETERRDEVIEYLLNKYPKRAAQICSYGLYRVDNLINDLAKVCGLEDKDEIIQIKSFINKHISEGILNMDVLLKSIEAKRWNNTYDNIIKHFSKLYNKVRFIGTHAAGVAITKGNILDYTSIRIDSKTKKYFTSYDLTDMEQIQVIKFDILGLTTMSSISELRKLTNEEKFNEDWVKDKKILEEFSNGNCSGIFQFDKNSVQEMLRTINVDSFEDIVAASAMNRPGPLSLRMPEIYAANKLDPSHIDTSLPYSKYLEKTHGCVIYQEQVQAIAVNIGNLEWTEADKILKMTRGGTEKAIRNFEENYELYVKKFEKGARRFGMTKEQSFNIFDNFFNYAFNKGHSTGYSLISIEEMFYKVYYPADFWYTKIKFSNKNDRFKYISEAVKSGIVIFLPHVNYTANDSLRIVDKEKVIQEGISSYKGIGSKTSQVIEDERKANGLYKSIEDFQKRMMGKGIGNKTIEFLIEQGALEFNKKRYLSRVVKYNSSLLGRC